MTKRKVLYIVVIILTELLRGTDVHAAGTVETTPPGMVTISQEEYRSLVEDHVRLLACEEAKIGMDDSAILIEGEEVEPDIEGKKGRFSFGGGVMANTNLGLGYFGLTEMRITDRFGVIGEVLYDDKLKGAVGLKFNPK